MASVLWLCGILLLFFGAGVNTGDVKIHLYDNKTFTKISNGLYVHGESEALFASKYQNVVASSYPGSHYQGMSIIRFDDITFVRTKEAATKQKSMLATSGLVETVVFEAKDRGKIGGSFFKSDAMCCTSELVDAGSCNRGEVIIRSEPDDEWPKRIQTFFEESKEEVKMSPEALLINKTGTYIVYFMTCDQDLDGTIVRGRTVWKNLDVYSLGKTTPYMLLYYGLVFLIFVVFSLVGFSDLMRKEIQRRQHIGFVTYLYIGEVVALLYLGGSSGTNTMEVWVVTLSSAKNALSRLLMLVISSHYGIFRPTTICGVPLRMFFVGVLCSLCFLISDSLRLENFYDTGTFITVLSWTLVETCFLQWVFGISWRTFNKLKLDRRMSIAILKQILRKVVILLLFMVVLMLWWSCVEGTAYYQTNWIMPIFRYLLGYALMVLICFFVTLNENPTRYLYVAEMEEEFQEDELSLRESGMNNSC